MDKLRCCGKPQSNLVCMGCSRIFHPSCFERDWKRGIKIGRGMIYCSEECQRQESDNLEKERLLNEEIRILKEELSEKNTYIRRLQRNSQVLEDDLLAYDTEHSEELNKHRKKILEQNTEIIQLSEQNSGLRDDLQAVRASLKDLTEKRSESRIEEQQDLLSDLDHQLSNLRKTKQELEGKIADFEANEKSMRNELSEFRKINQDMLDSIRVLEAQNDCYSQELSKLSGLKDGLANDTMQSAESAPLVSNRRNHSFKNQKTKILKIERLLILCDQQGRNFDKLLMRRLHSGVQIQTLIKPGASFLRVVEDIANLTKDMDFSDLVLVIGGLNDFKNGSIPRIKDIYDTISGCTNTNVALISVPFGQFGERVENMIFDFNCNLRRAFLGNNNVSCLETNINNSRVTKRIIVDKLIGELMSPQSGGAGRDGSFVGEETVKNFHRSLLSSGVR